MKTFEIIDILEKHICVTPSPDGHVLVGIHESAIAIVCALPSWIPVNERLPELTEPLMGYNDENVREVFIENYQATVWAYNPILGQYKANFSKQGWKEISSVSSVGGDKAIPTHWQPLFTEPQISPL